MGRNLGSASLAPATPSRTTPGHHWTTRPPLDDSVPIDGVHHAQITAEGLRRNLGSVGVRGEEARGLGCGGILGPHGGGASCPKPAA